MIIGTRRQFTLHENGQEICIAENVPIFKVDTFRRCKHVKEINKSDIENIDKFWWISQSYLGNETIFVIPYVIIATSDNDEYCSSEVCLQCLLEAAKTMGVSV